MSSRLRTWAIPIALSCSSLLLALAPDARADFIFHTWDDHHESQGAFRLDTDLLYYNSSSNYDYSKTTFTVSGLDSYTRLEGDFTGTYGVNPWLSVYARATLAKAQVNLTTGSANSTGFGDQTIGANARVIEPKDGGVALDLQLQLDFPGYSNTNATRNNTPYLGDGSTDLTFGAFVDYPFLHRAADHDGLSLVGGLGFTYRSESFASDLPYTVDLVYSHDRQGLMASVGFAGMVSLGNDARQYGTSNTYAISQSIGTGGSFVTNAIDPSLLYLRGMIGYQVSNQVALSVTAMKSIVGQQAPNGTEILGGATFHFGENAKKRQQPTNPRREVLEESDRRKNPALEDPAEYGRSNQGYVDYSLEAKVTKTNDRLNLVMIDKGSNDGIETGDTFDIFAQSKDPAGGSAIARGHVVRANPTESVVKITEYFQEVYIDTGATARRPVK